MKNMSAKNGGLGAPGALSSNAHCQFSDGVLTLIVSVSETSEIIVPNASWLSVSGSNVSVRTVILSISNPPTGDV